MRITLRGTRGSVPAPGPGTVRYGGNTSCVEVLGEDGTRLLLDAGTGIRQASNPPVEAARRIDVLLTHLHLDHIQGLGFFPPMDEAGREVRLWGPPVSKLDLGTRLSRYLSPPLFPVRLADMACRLSLHDVPLDGFEIGSLRIEAALVCHPGPTLGYRISENGRVFTYIPDHEPALGKGSIPDNREWISGFDLARGADLLIHDCQYGLDEYAQRVGWGHSALAHALIFAQHAGARQVVTFHHDPAHDDDTLDRMLRTAREQAESSMIITPGREGETFQI